MCEQFLPAEITQLDGNALGSPLLRHAQLGPARDLGAWAVEPLDSEIALSP